MLGEMLISPRGLVALSAFFVAGCGAAPPPPPAAPAPGSAPVAPPPSAQEPAASPPSSSPPSADVVGPPTQGKLYSLVVSFQSPGDGTDSAAFERLLGVVRDVGAAKVGRVSGRWGKEGEHDECFDLARLPHRERLAFVQRVRLATGTSDRVQISERAPCQHQPGR